MGALVRKYSRAREEHTNRREVWITGLTGLEDGVGCEETGR